MNHTNTNATTIGLDLGKNYIHMFGVNENGERVLKHVAKAENLLARLAKIPSCLIGIEACSGSHHWHREISKLGHTVKIISPQRAKAFNAGQKNDYNDADAICQAIVHRATRFVAAKNLEQQEISSLHAARSLKKGQQTQLINHMRGTLAEYGLTFRQGAKNFVTHMIEAMQEYVDKKRVPPLIGEELLAQVEDLKGYEKRIAELNKRLQHYSSSSDCKRLQTIPGIGPLGCVMLLAHGSSHYATARDYAASLGIVPRQHSTGGKQTLGGISKRGNVEARNNLIHGARTVLMHTLRNAAKGNPPRNRLEAFALVLIARGLHHNKVVVAMANKMARYAWVLLQNPEMTFVPFDAKIEKLSVLA